MELLKTFEERLALAIEKIKALKQEKENLQKRVKELEEMVKTKEMEIDNILSEKNSIKKQIEKLLNDLESLEL